MKRTEMEEEIASVIPNEGINWVAEGSDSNGSSNLFQQNKRQRHDNATSSARFKGVVLQQNGHWGAQIYANHQRIWLGTFKSEKEAAMAYDSAAIKLRSGDSHRNFPWTSLTIQEPNFQDLHSTEAVLNMIKDGSYQPKFKDFLRNQSLRVENEVGFNLVSRRVNGGFLCQQLFQKELTPSDVGKLNRLVIPKKHAIKYFPQVPEVSSEEDEGGGGGIDDVQLVFFDRRMRSWKFRYCYWKSSQSFVFTRGWNRFVKEKELKAKDIITFYRCECRESFEDQTFCMIDVGYNGGQSSTTGFLGGLDGYVGMKVELQLGLGQNIDCWWDKDEKKSENGENAGMLVAPKPQVEKKGIRIFGVQMS